MNQAIEIMIEIVGWASTTAFLISILMPNRVRLHQVGIFSSVTTGIYAYAHGATAIWVKWAIAFFFHAYMIGKTTKQQREQSSRSLLDVVTVAKAD
ncbi:MAG: hypothetical protein IPK04_14085 [Bdellovibrionales bacterium]|nr:hypothetical protein [Bdellovibrionales bacterium]